MKTNPRKMRSAFWASLFLLAPDLAGPGTLAQTYSVLHSFGDLTKVTGFTPLAPLIQGPDGTLYGTASEGEGGFNHYGTVFKLQPDGSGFTVLKHFTNYGEAVGPQAGLVLDGTTLYGTTEGNGGGVFKVNTDGSGFTVLKQFLDDAEGQSPHAGLALSGGILYGTTFAGGASGRGTVFKLNTDGSGFTVLHRFATTNGVNPYATLVVSGSTLYGTASGGGNNSKGTIFKLNTSGTGFTVLRHLATADGIYPHAGLTLAGSVLYGVTTGGGSQDYGTVFKINTDGSGFAVLKNFTSADAGGVVPSGRLWLSGTTLYGTAQAKYVDAGAVFKLDVSGTGFTVLKQFGGSDDEGRSPYAGLWLNGVTLYGTTRTGGADDVGTVFKVNTDGSQFATLKPFTFTREGINPGGQLVAAGSTLYGTTRNSAHARYGTAYKLNTAGSGFAVLHSFGPDATDGIEPRGGLTLVGNTLFGTTAAGGESGNGTVFRLESNGSNYAVVKSFASGAWADGFTPLSGLVCASNQLYGTTTEGGGGYGSLYTLHTNGNAFATLKPFDGGTEGGTPEAPLVLAGQTLYGTTFNGGSAGAGVIFKINTDGSGYTVLKDYDGTDGASPRPGLLLAGDTLYGLTEMGGSLGHGTLFKLNTTGSGYTVLKEFDGPTEGSYPKGGLVLSGATLYGTMSAGGAFDLGTVFKVNTDGSDFAVLKEFTGPEGRNPEGPLIVLDGALYGTTAYGGHLDAGVVFSLSLLPPLRVERMAANSLLLAWPYPSDGFALEQTPELTTATWTSVTNPPVRVGEEWQVIQSPAAGKRFYRLHKP